jgi:hypothetical protein
MAANFVEAMRLRDCHEVGLAASFSFQQLGARKIKLMVSDHEVGTCDVLARAIKQRSSSPA